MSEQQYDDSKTGGYSYAEKLALVAADQMDPRELGLTAPEEAAKLSCLPAAEPPPTLGDPINFRASEVPLILRARWAQAEQKILPFDQEAWMRENEGTHLIQGEIRSGNVCGRIQRLVTEPIDGFILLLRDAADQLEKLRAQMRAPTIELEEEPSESGPV